jgi:hypothetical protein
LRTYRVLDGGSVLTKRLAWLVFAIFGVAIILSGCDSSNATSGYGGGAVGNTPPNPANASGGSAYGTTGQ